MRSGCSPASRSPGATLPHTAIDHIESRQRESAGQRQLRVHDSSAPARSCGDGAVPIADTQWRQKVCIEGVVRSVQLGSAAGRSLEVQVFDDTGGLRLLFMGRTNVPGTAPGAVLRASGRVGDFHGRPAIANPLYEILEPSGAALVTTP